ncbi:MAG: hypothetical protein AAGF07_00415 [Patescibacteria group bacterium]
MQDEVKFSKFNFVNSVFISRTEKNTVPESEYLILNYSLADCERSFYFPEYFLPKQIIFRKGLSAKIQPNLSAVFNPNFWSTMPDVVSKAFNSWDETTRDSFTSASRAWDYIELQYAKDFTFKSAIGSNSEALSRVIKFCSVNSIEFSREF